MPVLSTVKTYCNKVKNIWTKMKRYKSRYKLKKYKKTWGLKYPKQSFFSVALKKIVAFA